jgi:ketosteroid isomerase-like protein
MVFRPARVSLRFMIARTPEETHTLLEAAFNAGDADAAAAAFAEDATMFDPHERRVVHGRDAIRKSIAPLVAGGRDSEITVLAKLESDGLALTHAHWRLGELSGHGTIVSRREPDGRWLIVLDNPLSAM